MPNWISARSRSKRRPGVQPEVREFSYHIDDLLETAPEDIGKTDIALLNLLCAPNVPGSEDLDIRQCLGRLDRLCVFVKDSTARCYPRFLSDPHWGHSEPMWRMALLVTRIKYDYGAAYDPVVQAELARDGKAPFVNSRNVFIHGLLSHNPRRRWGSCSSIPVLVVAVARRLGYPVSLAVNRKHVCARWDDGNGFTFNIEASNPAGMTVHSDDEYRNMFGPLTEAEAASGFYARTLTRAEEFALFMKSRAWCLHDAGRYAKTFLRSARALQFSPDDPHFAKSALLSAEMAIRQRHQQKHPDRPLPPLERNHEFFYNLGEFTTQPERSLFLTIRAHVAELDGDWSTTIGGRIRAWGTGPRRRSPRRLPSLRSLRSLRLGKRQKHWYSHSTWYQKWGQVNWIGTW